MPWPVCDGRNSEGLRPGSAALQIALYQYCPMRWPCAAHQSLRSNARHVCDGCSSEGLHVQGMRHSKLTGNQNPQCSGPELHTSHLRAMPWHVCDGCNSEGLHVQGMRLCKFPRIRTANAMALRCAAITTEQCLGMSALCAAPRACISAVATRRSQDDLTGSMRRPQMATSLGGGGRRRRCCCSLPSHILPMGRRGAGPNSGHCMSSAELGPACPLLQ